jgi:DNA invertase Pin-like site-specific DNA recombinase
MLVGYARISTADQHHALQHDALEAAGCEKIFTDTISGVKAQRPGLDDALKFVRSGDVLTVWRLDRLGRSLPHLLGLTRDLADRGVELRSLTESIDTRTAAGRLVFHVFAALAEFERDLTHERVALGRAAARARGQLGGRPPVLTREQERAVAALVDAGHMSIAGISRMFKCSRMTVHRARARTTRSPSHPDGGNGTSPEGHEPGHHPVGRLDHAGP